MSAGTPYFTAAWSYSGGGDTYTNNTNEARRKRGTAFAIMAATADYFYLGDEDRFDLAQFDIVTAGVLGELTWEYWNGSANAWSTFIPAFADLEGNEDGYDYDFTEDGAEIFVDLPGWTASDLDTVDGVAGATPDDTIRYWVRVSSPTSVSTAPTINMIRKRSYNSYCTPADVYEFLNLRWPDGAFDATTVPSLTAVENIIHRQEAYIDKMTRKSWRPNIAWEYYDFNLAGISLRKKPVSEVLKVEIWNGTEFENRIFGRNEEVFFVSKTNQIKFSRLFLLPARFTGLNKGYYGAGIGEFSDGVRIKYMYGRNRLTDSDEGVTLNDVAIKLAAIQLLTHHDYTKILTTGANSMDIQSKIMQWREEVKDTLGSMRSWEIF
jgi:hypothetical protein